MTNALTVAVGAPGCAHVVGRGAITVPPRTQLQPDVLVYPPAYPLDIKEQDVAEHRLAVEVPGEVVFG